MAKPRRRPPLPVRFRLDVVEQPPAQLVRETHDTRADRCAIAPVLALAAARGDLLGKVPEPARGDQGAGLRVAAGRPLWGKAEAGRDLCVFGLDYLDNPFLLEALVRVLEGLLVDCLEVAEVALVIKGFSELRKKKVC